MSSHVVEAVKPAKGGRRRGSPTTGLWSDAAKHRLEALMEELFHLHDLNGDGVLDETELVKLNQKIAMLHYGGDTDLKAVTQKYKNLFRSKLDPNGQPVPYIKFRSYAQEVLDGLDGDPEAQEMILEQFVAEAQSGRQALGLFTVGCQVEELIAPRERSRQVGTSVENPDMATTSLNRTFSGTHLRMETLDDHVCSSSTSLHHRSLSWPSSPRRTGNSPKYSVHQRIVYQQSKCL